LKDHRKLDLDYFNHQLDEDNNEIDSSLKSFREIYLKMLEHQRNLLDQMNHKEEFDEDIIRKYLSVIDIEEFKIREKILEETTAA
jgi:CPA1 family monovalent cation:H+ antiporter